MIVQVINELLNNWQYKESVLLREVASGSKCRMCAGLGHAQSFGMKCPVVQSLIRDARKTSLSLSETIKFALKQSIEYFQMTAECDDIESKKAQDAAKAGTLREFLATTKHLSTEETRDRLHILNQDMYKLSELRKPILSSYQSTKKQSIPDSKTQFEVSSEAEEVAGAPRKKRLLKLSSLEQ